jgi:hypothetical protein
MAENLIYAAARERLAALEAERDELLAFIRTYERLALAAPGAQPVPSSTAPPKRWSSAEIVHAAMEVLAERKRPMKLAELFDAVVAKGVEIGGKNPRNNFGAMLSADKSRLTTGPDGWYFKDEYPRQLDDGEYDEGLAIEAARPCLSNGAAGSYPVRT